MMIVRDQLVIAEETFYKPELLESEYMEKYRAAYYLCKDKGLLNPHRNYLRLLQILKDIKDYNSQHAESFVKRIKSQHTQWNDCEAVTTEMIVYHHYIRMSGEELVRSISIRKDECDLVVERSNGTKMYLEVFCVMPDIKLSTPDKVVVNKLQTHTQSALSSIRQKILQKIQKQGQLSKARENYAVIELNHVSIADDFAVLSSLSDGFKVNIDLATMAMFREGFDWSTSFFDDPATKFLKGIIWFSLGAYQDRNLLLNPSYKAET